MLTRPLLLSVAILCAGADAPEPAGPPIIVRVTVASGSAGYPISPEWHSDFATKHLPINAYGPDSVAP
jgi:hypothetical protein